MKRTVRSFVRRTGRMSDAQKRALSTLSERFELKDAQQSIDWLEESPQSPLVLDIGFGMGHSLIEMAQCRPHERFLGVDVYRPGVGAVMNQLDKLELDHVRVVENDANLLIDDWLPDNSVDRCQIYFPDPWPKKRHHKRRLVQVDFLSRLKRVVKPGGMLHIATDWQPYAEFILEQLAQTPEWQASAQYSDHNKRPDFRPETKYERRGVNLGHEVSDIVCELSG